MKLPNRYAEAFKENFNIIGLAGSVAVAAALINPVVSPLVLLSALVLEAAYLIFVPDSRWYTDRLSRRHDAEIQARRDQIKAEVLPTLRPDLQRRFLRLEEMRAQIGTLSMGERTWFLEVLRKLDFLLDKYLQFAAKEGQFRAYLTSILTEAHGEAVAPPGTNSNRPSWLDSAFDASRGAPNLNRQPRRGKGPSPGVALGPAGVGSRQAPGQMGVAPGYGHPDQWTQNTVAEVQKHYDGELGKLRALAKEEKDDGTRAVLEKRCEVLERRREFVSKMGRILQNLNHQLELLEDTFGLISDEIRARPPEQVLADIEDVVTQTNTMTQVLEEIAPYEQSLARLMN
ncbi:MAG TPA: hypothetical protein VGB77_12415 [Abditibacteriaceae bacterium]|jgi:hypothetical protein